MRDTKGVPSVAIPKKLKMFILFLFNFFLSETSLVLLGVKSFHSLIQVMRHCHARSNRSLPH